MTENPFVIYYGVNEEEHLLPVDAYEKNSLSSLPDIFFFPCAGLYLFAGKAWNIEKEGLYRFTDREGNKRQHCYFKKNIDSLVKTVMLCSDFSGVDMLQHKNKEELMADLCDPNIKGVDYRSIMFFLFLLYLYIPWRGIIIYSVKNEVPVWCLFEIWSESYGQWKVYGFDTHSYYGFANSERTFEKIFDEILENKCCVQKLLERKQKLMKDFWLEENHLLENYNQAILSQEKLSAFLKENDSIPVMMDNAYKNDLYTNKKYKEKLSGTEKLFMIGNESELTNLHYVSEEHIKNVIYGPQTFVMPGKLIKTN